MHDCQLADGKYNESRQCWESEVRIMNEDILKGKWHELRGEVKARWGKITDDDLTVISGRSEKLLGVLQTRYGYAKDKAETEYKDFLSRLKK
jgi:uncharacterized protein YjbJ (UPF0337 family)